MLSSTKNNIKNNICNNALDTVTRSYNGQFLAPLKTYLISISYVKEMILNRQQKEKLVIDLLNQGFTYPQIAKRAHVSFSEIKRIELMVTGDDKKEQDEEADKEKKAKPIHSQAFECFCRAGPRCRWPSTWIWRLAGQ